MEIARINTAAPKPAQSSIMIIYTGGTLGMVYNKAGHLIPFDFDQILRNVPELIQFECELTVFSLPKLIDSSNMRPAIWVDIARTIAQNYTLHDGFVILHGTDTMAYSASALSFLLEGLNKPVIFTGAQLPIGAIRTDARRNLITSLEVAMAKQGNHPMISEVCIFFNDLLLRGNRAKKEETSHFDAFQSENYPNLAKVGAGIHYNEGVLMSYQATASLKVNPKMCAQVAILKLFPGITETMVQAVLSVPGLKGVVLETYGSGNAPTDTWFIESLKKAIDRGVHILNISQCIGGQVLQGRYETSRAFDQIGVMSGGDMTSEAAITKLMYLLGKDLPEDEVKTKLQKSLCGEITEIFD